MPIFLNGKNDNYCYSIAIIMLTQDKALITHCYQVLPFSAALQLAILTRAIVLTFILKLNLKCNVMFAVVNTYNEIKPVVFQEEEQGHQPQMLRTCNFLETCPLKPCLLML